MQKKCNENVKKLMLNRPKKPSVASYKVILNKQKKEHLNLKKNFAILNIIDKILSLSVDK